MSCILGIGGKYFDVDAFIKKNKLRPYKVSYKGQPLLQSKPNGKKLANSLLCIQTSGADFNDLAKQIKDTIRYLSRNKEKLSQIKKTKTIQFAVLDFGIDPEN